MLLGKNDRFAGFVMNKATGLPFANTIFNPSVVCQLWNWRRPHLVQRLRFVLQAVLALHEVDVLLGDINGFNILTTAPGPAWIVDCDSSQIGRFPCPVGTPDFTPPELHGLSFASTLRTPEHESFAIAVLVFRVLFLGKQPYAQPGTETQVESMKAMRFPYALPPATGNPPHGPWLAIWKSLPRSLQEAFAQTFDCAYRGQRRRTTREWLGLLEEYSRLLATGRLPPALFPGLGRRGT